MATYNQKVGTFLKSHKGQNKRALEMILLGVEHMLENNKEWTGTARLITSVEPRMGKMMQRVLGEVLGGVTKRADSKQPTGIRFVFGENYGPTDKLDSLRDLVEAGESIYGTAVQKFVGMDQDKPVVFNAEARFKAIATAAVNNEIELERAIDLLKEGYRKAELAKADAIESAPVAAIEEI